MSKKKDPDRRRMLLEIIGQARDSSMAWVIRKEIAAWTAAAFYLAGLLTVCGFVINESDNILLIIVSNIGAFLVLCIFLVFIHSQYSSAYYQTAVHAATLRCSFLISKGKIPSGFSLSIKKTKAYPEFLEKNLDSFYRQNCHFKKRRFIKILSAFWTIKRRRLSVLRLSVQERQEAAIYSLLFTTSFLFFAISVIFLLPCFSGWWVLMNCIFALWI